jgi:hypothetical protein
MSIVIPLFIVAMALFMLAAGRFAERKIHRTQTLKMMTAVSLAGQHLASQQRVERELLDVVARQRHLLQVLVEAADPKGHPALRNNEYIVQWVARRARQTLL